MTLIDDYLEMHQEYQKQYGKIALLMQVGMFYEYYGVDNAQEKLGNVAEVSSTLNIQMTRKNKKITYNDRGNPLFAGVPVHAVNRFLDVLMKNGFTVVVVDQDKESSKAGAILDRKIKAIYSPGTYIPEKSGVGESLSVSTNNLVSLIFTPSHIGKRGSSIGIGMACVDVSTGKSKVYEAWDEDGTDNTAMEEARRFLKTTNPSEVILSIPNNVVLEGDEETSTDEFINHLDLNSTPVHFIDEQNWKSKCFKLDYQNQLLGEVFRNHGMLTPIEFLDLEKMNLATTALTCMLKFAEQHDERIISKIWHPEIWEIDDHLVLVNNCISQLNLTSSNNLDISNSKYDSLFKVINCTKTPMGRRLLEDRLTNPLYNSKMLTKRYILVDKCITKLEHKSYQASLSEIQDLERMTRRMSIQIINPYEMVNMIHSVAQSKLLIDKIKSEIPEVINDNYHLIDLSGFLDDVEMWFDNDEMAKWSLNNIGSSFIRSKINSDLDKLQDDMTESTHKLEDMAKNVSEQLLNFDSKIKQKGEIVKVDFTEAEGYYLWITNSKKKILDKMIKSSESNDDTLTLQIKKMVKNSRSYAGGFRLLSPHITELSNKILALREKVRDLTRKIYLSKLGILQDKYVNNLFQVSDTIAQMDIVCSSAQIAIENKYCKPLIEDGESFIEITELRHPIIEKINQKVPYVPNDITLGKNEDGMLCYGTNASGKSSLMKAVGLSVIMAQMGMYVPAKSFKFSPFKQLLTRITDGDNIFKGQSTFVIEMLELRTILKRANPYSLILGDEICHGTEQTSGLAIVASSIEKMAKQKAKFIFATHLHDLSKLHTVNNLDNVGHYHLKVHYRNSDDTLIYDRQLENGPGDAIYGLEVAKYVIQDNDFINQALELRRNIMGNKILPTIQQSKYNSGLYLGKCKICDNDGEHTHHIIFQCQADQDGMIDFYHKNRMSNLVILCEECHHKVHSNKIWITGYLDTSNGPILNWGNFDTKKTNDEIQKKEENNDNNNKIKKETENNDKIKKETENNKTQVNDKKTTKDKKTKSKLLDEYVIESKSHHSKEEVMSTSSDDSNPDHEKGYNDLCKNDNRTYLVNRSLTKYHIKDTGIEGKNISICRSKTKLKAFNGYPNVFVNKICQKCLHNSPL
jgi:DNA mismatch repair protein MutS